MIHREIGDDGICTLTFDRPDSGANIFDAPTMESLREHVEAIEKDSSIKGVIVISAKKSIFIAGADLKTLLRQAQTGEMRGFIAEGQKVFNRLAALEVPSVAAIHGANKEYILNHIPHISKLMVGLSPNGPVTPCARHAGRSKDTTATSSCSPVTRRS